MKFVAKEDVKKYPLIDFTARVHLIEDLKDVSKCFDVISSATLIGFDTETKPTFVKGPLNPPSILQLACIDKVYIFQLDNESLYKKLLKHMVYCLTHKKDTKKWRTTRWERASERRGGEAPTPLLSSPLLSFVFVFMCSRDISFQYGPAVRFLLILLVLP